MLKRVPTWWWTATSWSRRSLSYQIASAISMVTGPTPAYIERDGNILRRKGSLPNQIASALSMVTGAA
jgi:hypothetical protein